MTLGELLTCPKKRFIQTFKKWGWLFVSGHLIFQLCWSWSMYGNSIKLPSESGTGISEKCPECMSDLRMGLRLNDQFPGKLSLEAL